MTIDPGCQGVWRCPLCSQGRVGLRRCAELEARARAGVEAQQALRERYERDRLWWLYEPLREALALLPDPDQEWRELRALLAEVLPTAEEEARLSAQLDALTAELLDGIGEPPC